MQNPVAMMAGIVMFLLAVVYAIKREDTPWYLATAAFLLLSFLFLNIALGTPSLAELAAKP